MISSDLELKYSKMKNAGLLSLEEADSLPMSEITSMYRQHVSPGIATFLKILGLDQIRVSRAEGMYLFTDDDRKILDFSGGMNVLNHGHNHPRIMAARRAFNENNRLEICKAFVSQYQAVLAHNLAKVFPGDLNYTFFCNSGAEAIEGALKLAQVYHGVARDKFLHTDLGYHGKTFGALSVTGSLAMPEKTLVKQLEGCIEVPFGDLDAVKAVIERRLHGRKHDVAAMVIEAIKGDLVLQPPANYLPELSALCRQYGIVLICDEVFTGFGKTGRMFAFEHFDIVPDIVAFSKTIGGGKASLAGYIANSNLYKKAYGSLGRSIFHTTTYGGMGEECATAIEALNVIVEEDLVVAAQENGLYLKEKLEQMAEKYPHYIKQARGLGLLCILELRSTSQIFKTSVLPRMSFLDDMLIGLAPAVIVSELFRSHDVLIYTGGREDNLFINPSLIVTREQIDSFITALDAVFNANLITLAMRMGWNVLP